MANPPTLGSFFTAAPGPEQQEDKRIPYTLTDHSNNPLKTLTWPNPAHLELKYPKSRHGDPAPWAFQRANEEEQGWVRGDVGQSGARGAWHQLVEGHGSSTAWRATKKRVVKPLSVTITNAMLGSSQKAPAMLKNWRSTRAGCICGVRCLRFGESRRDFTVCPTAMPARGEAGGHPRGSGQLLGGSGRRQHSCGTWKASAWLSGFNSARNWGFRKKRGSLWAAPASV